MNDNEKLELLWKHFRNVTPTNNVKSPHNEALLRRDPIFQKDFWTDSDRIPMPAPSVVIPDGNELWFEIIRPYKGTNAIQLVADPTSATAFHAMDDYSLGLIEENRLRNWVPGSLDRSYTVRVYAGNPASIAGDAVRLYPSALTYEWEFDYATGVLYFLNEVPPVAEQNGIWIEAWTYIGEIGREGLQGGAANTSKIRTYTFTTTPIIPNGFLDFTFPTGGKCILVEAKVTSPCTLECHSVADRSDTNPYRFKAITDHLVDDGSYVSAGQRYYGERFVPLINMEDTTSDLTYWRIINDDTAPRVITIIVQVA